MAELEFEAPAEWNFKPTKEIADAKGEGGASNAYFGEAPNDAFLITEAKMEKYAKEVTAPEQEILPNKMRRTYFEEIYKPTEFSPQLPGRPADDGE